MASGITWGGPWIEDDHVLDMLVQNRRHSKVAKKCFRQLLKGLQPVPRVVITDPLKRYGAAKREMLPGVEHRQSCSLHKRCENLRRPMRQRERRLHRFKSAAQAQRLLSALSPLFPHVRPRRHLLLASESHNEMRQRFESGAEITVYEAGGLRAGSVGIEPQRRLLLSSDEISLNKLTKPAPSQASQARSQASVQPGDSRLTGPCRADVCLGRQIQAAIAAV